MCMISHNMQPTGVLRSLGCSWTFVLILALAHRATLKPMGCPNEGHYLCCSSFLDYLLPTIYLFFFLRGTDLCPLIFCKWWMAVCWVWAGLHSVGALSYLHPLKCLSFSLQKSITSERAQNTEWIEVNPPDSSTWPSGHPETTFSWQEGNALSLLNHGAPSHMYLWKWQFSSSHRCIDRTTQLNFGRKSNGGDPLGCTPKHETRWGAQKGVIPLVFRKGQWRKPFKMHLRTRIRIPTTKLELDTKQQLPKRKK